jgi:hypothetical protein
MKRLTESNYKITFLNHVQVSLQFYMKLQIFVCMKMFMLYLYFH